MYNGNSNIRFISCKIGNVRNENCQKYTKDCKDCTQASRFIARFEFIKYLKTLVNRMKVYLLLCCLNCSIHIGYHVHDAHKTILGKREKLENFLCNGFWWNDLENFLHTLFKHDMFFKRSKEQPLTSRFLYFLFHSFPFHFVMWSGAKKRFIPCSICLYNLNFISFTYLGFVFFRVFCRQLIWIFAR